jgi:UDP:flavonoid glycosyltransferase YjiC (YdhE family)
MLPLARALTDAGAQVVWATGEPAAQRLRDEGFTVYTAGPSEGAKASPLVLARAPEIAALPARERPNQLFGKVFGYQRTAPMLADLLPVVDAAPPDLIVRDMAEFASPIAAAAHRIPCITHSLGALLPAGRIAAAGADVAPLWEAQGLEPRPFGGSYDDLYLDIYPPSLQDQCRPQVPRSTGLRSVPLPIEAPAHNPFPHPAGRPLVYVTFGTVFNDSEPLRRVVEGVRDLDVSVVVTVGPGGDPEVLGAQPGNVRVARFVPQDDLLPHCAAVVSHAGSGTFLGAVAHGLPQVCVPQGADQFLNADAAVCGGIGSSVAADPAEVRRALKQALTDSRPRFAARRVQSELAAMPSAEEVAAMLLERYRGSLAVA